MILSEHVKNTELPGKTESMYALTIEAWVTRERTGQMEVVVSKWSETPDRQSWCLYIDEDDYPCFMIRDGNIDEIYTVKAKTPLSVSYQPYHLAAVYDTLPSNDPLPSDVHYTQKILVDGKLSSWRWVCKKEDLNWQLSEPIKESKQNSETEINLHSIGEGKVVNTDDILLLGNEHVKVASPPVWPNDYGYADYRFNVLRGQNDTPASEQSDTIQIYRLSAESRGIATSPTVVSIGHMDSGLYPFQGSINEVQILPEALTDQQIQNTVEAARGRTNQNLQVLYTFEEGSGNTVRDVSGVGESLNLVSADDSTVDWESSSGGLVLAHANRLQSRDTAKKLIEAAKDSNEITVEAWIVPPTESPASLVPLVTLASGPGERNFMLGQYQNSYHARLQTSDTELDGSDQPLVWGGENSDQLVHLAYTRTYEKESDTGKARFFINGKEVFQRRVNGDFSNWDDDFVLTLGNYPDGTHTWMGAFHLVAVYNRALNPIEIFWNCEYGADKNLPPVIDAGPDQIIYLEKEEGTSVTAVLSGKVVDDRKISDQVNITWTMDTPSTTGVIVNVNSLNAQATFHKSGTYIFVLTADDGSHTVSDQLTITVIENKRPEVVITSPSDETIVKMPDNIVLEAVVMDDGIPDPPARLIMTWSRIDPGQEAEGVIFSPPDSEYTQASFLKPGFYHLRLTTNDNHLEGFDEIALHVYDSPVIRIETEPIVNLPGSGSLQGIIVDNGLGGQDGSIIVLWEGLSGVIPDPTDSQTTMAEFPDKGMYTFRFTVDNGQLPPVSKEVTITVNKSPEITVESAPFVNLPANGELIGKVLDDGLGNPSSGKVRMQWAQVSGPQSAKIINENAPITTVEFPDKGIYQFRFTVDNGLLHPVSKELTVVVNKSPIVTASLVDGIITLPETAKLVAEVMDDGFGDPDQQVLSHPKGGLVIQWMGDGPGTVVFEDPSALSTTAKFEIGGIYTLTLTVDNGYIDPVLIQLTLVVNQAPVVDAGLDQVIILPATAHLAGIVTDDGLPDPPGALTVKWEVVSGPESLQTNANFADSSSPGTTSTFSTNGTYILRLTASDGETSTSDEVNIVVHQAPVIDAGPDQTIAFKTPCQLNGKIINNGLGAPGSGKVEIEWKLDSTDAQNGDVSFQKPSTLDATATFTKQGNYTLQLQVNNGHRSSIDKITIHVGPPGRS